MSKPYWKTQTGQLVSVDDMTENHLRNTLKWIIKNNPYFCSDCGYIVPPTKEHTKGCQKVKKKVATNATKFRLNGDIAQSFNDTMEYLHAAEEANWHY